MAKRPVFIPAQPPKIGVVAIPVEFQWHPGLSKQQKQKSIASLHERARSDRNIGRILEISSKSPDRLGIALSAFNLRGLGHDGQARPVEVLFQAAKVFSQGGPFIDLLDVSPKDAKRDSRLKSSGKLLRFSCGTADWPLVPATVFYDWLYINALVANPDLTRQIETFDGFTDIEFNPEKSINCQASSAALYLSLKRQERLDWALKSKENFLELATDQKRPDRPVQEQLF